MSDDKLAVQVRESELRILSGMSEGDDEDCVITRAAGTFF